MTRLRLLAAAVGLATVVPPCAAFDCSGISQASGAALTTVRVVSGVIRPVLVASPPGDVTRIFFLEQDGRVRIIKNGTLLAMPFLDLSALVQSPADGGGS